VQGAPQGGCFWSHATNNMECTFTSLDPTKLSIGARYEVSIIQDSETFHHEPVYITVRGPDNAFVEHDPRRRMAAFCSLCYETTALDCPQDCNGEYGGAREAIHPEYQIRIWIAPVCAMDTSSSCRSLEAHHSSACARRGALDAATTRCISTRRRQQGKAACAYLPILQEQISTHSCIFQCKSPPSNAKRQPRVLWSASSETSTLQGGMIVAITP